MPCDHQLEPKHTPENGPFHFQGHTPYSDMNQIMVIFPYKYHGQWVFDDPSKGLDKEALVSGIDTMLDEMSRDIPNGAAGVKVLFSEAPFPGYSLKLDWRREEFGGNWYFSDRLGYEGWLCPALFKYFEKAPKQIYASVKPKAA